MEKLSAMAFDPALQHKRASASMQGILALSLIFLCATVQAPQQPAAKQSARKQSAKSTSPLLAEAEALLREGRVADAKSKIQEELLRNPANAEAYDLLGVACINEKDYPGALEAFQHALKLAPDSTRTRNSIGNVYVAQGKLDLAEQEFRTVLRLAPGNRDANYNLGLVLLAQGSPAKAILHFQRVRPANLETRFNLTRAYLQASRTAEGLKSATELSSENQADVQLHFTLGVGLVFARKFRCGLQTFGSPASLKVCARQVESGFEIRRPDALKMPNCLSGGALCQ